MEYGLVAVWWLAYVGLGLFGLPVAARLCSTLPGRGAGFSLTLSCAILTLVAFWVGYLALGWVALLAGLAALSVCAVLAVRAGVDIDRRAATEALVVFTVVYAGVIAVRAADPGITPQGEKFLDFGLVVSLYRSASLPPEDFWFAGKPIIYYYGGHFLASLLTRLTGTHPWYGFNLAMAGFYGMLASGAYELAGSVAVGRRRSTETTTGRTRLLAGVTALFFTMWASTLSTVVRMVVRRLPVMIRDEAAEAVASVHWFISPSWLLSPIPADGYRYKVAARIVPPATQNPFPLFAIVRGDMRPYLLSSPFLVCVAGLCYAYYRTPETALRRRRALVFGAIPTVAGFMVLVNTWSLAVVLGIVWLTLTFADANLRSLLPPGTRSDVDSFVGDAPTDSPSGALARIIGALPFAAVVGVVGVVVALPFVLGPLMAAPKTSLVTLAPEARSPLGSLLLVHGTFLAVILAYYLGRARERWSVPLAAAGVLWFVVLVVLAPETLAPLGLFAIPLAIGWYLLTTDRTIGFEGVMLVAGFGLVLLAELVFIQDGNGRFNTVVKTYMPTWVLWASATGVVLPKLVRGRGPWSWRRHRQQIGAVFVALLVISTGVYGVVALRSHFAGPHPDEPTLDGLAAAEREIPGQVEAIRWLYNRSGRPTIVSAPGFRVYRWSANPAASLTGLPTVVGVSHEAQYRGRKAYVRRVRVVNTIYLVSDERRADLLQRYDVEYIYVGPTERARYGTIPPLSPLRGVSVAFQAGNVTIYAVNQSRLRAG